MGSTICQTTLGLWSQRLLKKAGLNRHRDVGGGTGFLPGRGCLRTMRRIRFRIGNWTENTFPSTNMKAHANLNRHWLPPVAFIDPRPAAPLLRRCAEVPRPPPKWEAPQTRRSARAAGPGTRRPSGEKPTDLRLSRPEWMGQHKSEHLSRARKLKWSKPKRV